MAGPKKSGSIDDYIKSSPKESHKHLKQLRAVLKKAAPKATEGIKWRSAVLIDERILFAYRAYRDHINFMPTASSLKPFKKELAKFKMGKDTIQLPYDKPIPSALIMKIAKYRVKDVKAGAKWMGRN